MKYRTLRHADRPVSEIGLGCASWWGKKVFSEKTAQRVVRQALDTGITVFDTGASYANGHAEVRLGRALRHIAGRDDLWISTKVGTRVGAYGRLYKDFSANGIRQSVHNSLQALGLSRLPILFLHGPNPPDFNDDTFEVLEKLQREGLVGLVGVNSFNDYIIRLAVDCGRFQCLMTDFNVLKPARAGLIADLRQQGLDVFVAAALAGGLYSHSFYRPYLPRHFWYWVRALVRQRQQLKQARRLFFLNQVPGWQATELALAYVLQSPHHACALVGTASPCHLRELAAVSGRKMPDDIARRIRQMLA